MPRLQPKSNKKNQQPNTPAPVQQSASSSTLSYTPADRVSTKIEDFLKNDQSIPGQNFVCLSFISPEEVVANKNVFMVHCFLRNLLSGFQFSEEPTLDELKFFKNEMFKHLDSTGTDDKFRDFMTIHQEEMEKKYFEINNFQTTIRGLKVRGVYDTYVEAKARSEEIRTQDKNFNVYVGQVGYWLPWDPNPMSIKDQEYQETELNTLVKKYNENLKMKDKHFQENIDYVKEQAAKQAEKTKNEQYGNKDENSEQESSVEQPTSSDSLNSVDPWLQRKQEESDEKSSASSEEQTTSESSVVSASSSSETETESQSFDSSSTSEESKSSEESSN